VRSSNDEHGDGVVAQLNNPASEGASRAVRYLFFYRRGCEMFLESLPICRVVFRKPFTNASERRRVRVSDAAADAARVLTGADGRHSGKIRGWRVA